jgi:hypothetical protein
MMSMGTGKSYYGQSRQEARHIPVEAFGECADHAKAAEVLEGGTIRMGNQIRLIGIGGEY